MPLELGVWRIDQQVVPVEVASLDLEARLEDVLEHDISIASPNWMIVGRQVRTDHGHFIDLLALDRDGTLVILELKRDRTCRDIVAQLLDYGSWVRDLKSDRIAQIFDDYQERRGGNSSTSLDDAFRQRFGIEIPDELNTSHELVFVAASLDSATERVIEYLAEEYGVRINAVFFRVFRDDGREYLSRAWLRDPAEITASTAEQPATRRRWNGEYYTSFGKSPEVVRDGLKLGYLVAGGGSWYSNTLKMLEPGDRIWANVPGTGYVGVGTVEQTMRPVDEFEVLDENGRRLPITQVSEVAASLRRADEDPEKADYLVGVRWEKFVDPDDAIKEKGFFGNQNSVARPVTPAWDHTVERLKKRFEVE